LQPEGLFQGKKPTDNFDVLLLVNIVFEDDVSPVGIQTVSGRATICPQIAKLSFKQHTIHGNFPYTCIDNLAVI